MGKNNKCKEISGWKSWVKIYEDFCVERVGDKMLCWNSNQLVLVDLILEALLVESYKRSYNNDWQPANYEVISDQHFMDFVMQEYFSSR